MANKLFNQLNNNQNQPNFVQFMQMMKGQNPNAILNDMISSGKVSQEQLNAVQQYANKKMGMFNQFKSMFGFK